ncbi:MAG: hypothetical protein IKI65_03195 [Firmicutes bacterium]|nr:hypothetical protein [Bacillota bacterium]MBR6351191.1 hypothetical protein [Bacillota bacterium]
MARKTGRDYAGHLTQVYRKYDGSDKTFTDPDVRNLEFLYSAVGNYLEDHKGSDEMRRLHTRLGKLTSGLRECSERINKGTIDSRTLDEQQEELGTHAVAVLRNLGKLEGEEKELTKKYSDHINNMECKKAESILHASGEQKSAAKWIEEIQKGIKKYDPKTTPEKVAMIFAARQLADAKFGKRANIDKNTLTMAEIKNQAAKLMGDPEFKKYAEEVLPKVDSKTMEHGHGGRLEQTFEKFLAKNPAEKPREFDLHGRYMEAIKPAAIDADWVHVNYEMAGVQDPKTPKLVPEQEYRDYSDYIKKNAGKPVVGSKLAQAAKMAAANELSRKKPEDPFDKKALQKKTQEFMKDKNFKIMVADKENVDKLLKGDFVGFATEAGDIKTSCDAMLDADGQLELNGYPTFSLDRLEERVEQNPDLKPIVDSVNKLLPGDDEKVKHSPEEVMEAVGTIVDYQNKHAADHLGEEGKDLSDSMRLLHELTKGRYINRLVDKQMDMINGVRNFKPEHPSYLTRKLIEKEGLDAEKQAKIDLGIEEPEKEAPKAEKKVEGPDKLNKGVNYGHGPVA